MYNMTRLGYEYGTVFDSRGNVTAAGTKYNHVFGVLVNGVADETKVVPSNDPANTHTIDPESTETKNRNDVNQSNSCDIYDLVAVQAVYNVDTVQFVNDKQMHIALKCDVTGNKMVNMQDYQMIKSAS